MMVYFINGLLPWQGLKTVSRPEKYRRVLEIKQATSVKELCQGLPSAFTSYFTYLRSLRETDVPDYRYLRGLFRRLFRQQGFKHDFVYDWTLLEFYRQQSEVTLSSSSSN